METPRRFDGLRNRLQFEKSPYLLQHAGNPVDWYPWGDEAFERAAREDKPVFLSIGYSTCHWCHVMEQESFANREVARLLNDVFVCIKVDREERPDIDGVYMTVCQAATGSGGWPLTVLMTPDKDPFYVTTYIPKSGRYGKGGLTELVPHVKWLWQTRREELYTAVRQNIEGLRRLTELPKGGSLDEEVIQQAFQELLSRFDQEHGGFDGAPKFPMPHNLTFLLRYWKKTGDSRALNMVERTLRAMRLGGIYDHLGFGFHRYSTDEDWLVPHFEKMLYDQALVALAYLEAFQATQHRGYADTAREILTYVIRDLAGAEGGFYSAEDADSEGVEGKFYVWSEEEIKSSLESSEADLVIRSFGVRPTGNWADPAGHGEARSNVLHRKRTTAELASEMNLAADLFRARLEEARVKLFAVREKRTHPYKDDKVLTDWNGLIIAALSRASQVLGDSSYADSAKRAAVFILTKMRNDSGGLLHRWRDDEASIEANLDDYAFLTWGLIELYEATFETQFLSSALDLIREQIIHFWDEKDGAFFFTADNGEQLLVRQKAVYDGALPSGNSVSMLNLLMLARMTGNTAFEERAERLSRAVSGAVSRYPAGHTQLLAGLCFARGPSREIVLVGSPESPEMQQMIGALRTRFIPEKVVLLRSVGSPEVGPPIEEMAPFLRTYGSGEGTVQAHVCLNNACILPTSDPQHMLELLGEGSAERHGRG